MLCVRACSRCIGDVKMYLSFNARVFQQANIKCTMLQSKWVYQGLGLLLHEENRGVQDAECRHCTMRDFALRRHRGRRHRPAGEWGGAARRGPVPLVILH